MSALSKTNLNLNEFSIPLKYHSGAPWPLAQAQLQKINSYRAPHDKFNCIAECWTLISDSVSLLDNPEPDTLLGIMSYVIAVSKIENIITNRQ